MDSFDYSEIVDRCFGLLRSHVTCTNCGYQSVTFDPYRFKHAFLLLLFLSFVVFIIFVLRVQHALEYSVTFDPYRFKHGCIYVQAFMFMHSYCRYAV